MYRKLIIGGLLALLWTLPASARIDSKSFVERAVALIDEARYPLARSYLAPALIDFRLTPQERSRAYYLRGYSYYAQRLYVSAAKDYHRALEFNPGNPAAQAALGNLLYRGWGITRDPELAYGLFLQAAHGGHVGARFQVAIAELNGVGTDQDLPSARRWLKGLVEQGHTAALIHLARSYRAGVAEVPQPAQAQRLYQQAWESGNADGLLGLAFMHQKGELGAVDADRALALFRQAADAGSGAAQVSLGHMYLTGDGVPQDYRRALDLFHAAADQEIGSSFVWLGHMYQVGLGVTADVEAARAWYRRGSDAGLVDAQTRLAALLLRSDDLQAHREALRVLARAAEVANPRAQNDYAWVLATHPQATLRDGDLALAFAEKAVAQQANATYLDTLAAAHAEVGDFDAAISAQQAALDLLDGAERELQAELLAHLAAYQERRPWRE